MRHSIVFVGVVHAFSASGRRSLCVSVCVCRMFLRVRVLTCISVENNASLSLTVADRRTETSSPRHPSFDKYDSIPLIFLGLHSQTEAF